MVISFKSLTKIPMIILFFISLSGYAQIPVNKNDSIKLKLDGMLHGTIQWQESEDSISWVDIEGANHNFFNLKAEKAMFYRAKVSSGSCIPIYSDIQEISIIEFRCGDTLIDNRDGKKYPTLLIGDQCWMAVNLDLGSMIINGSQTSSDNGVIEKFCYNNDANNCKVYGGLYHWNEMMNYTTIESTQGICPVGWHIPSDNEWISLEIALGMHPTTAHLENSWRGTDEGKKMIEGGSSGFNALLSGNAVEGGFFNSIGEFSYLHSSTQYGQFAWRRCLSKFYDQVGRFNSFPKSYYLSVRCVKD